MQQTIDPDTPLRPLTGLQKLTIAFGSVAMGAGMTSPDARTVDFPGGDQDRICSISAREPAAPLPATATPRVSRTIRFVASTARVGRSSNCTPTR